MKAVLSAAIVVLLPLFGAAESERMTTLETQSFVVEFPEGWQVQSSDGLHVATGTQGASVTVSSVRIESAAAGSTEQADPAANVYAAATEAFQQSFPQETWVTQIPMRVQVQDSGVELREILVTSRDSLRYGALLVATSGPSIVVVTVEGQAQAIQEYVLVRQCLVAAKWK